MRRKAGWLSEDALRNGMRDQWATNRGSDSVSVTLGCRGGEFIVRAVRISNDEGYQHLTTTHSDLTEARNRFTALVERLGSGDHVAAFTD